MVIFTHLILQNSFDLHIAFVALQNCRVAETEMKFHFGKHSVRVWLEPGTAVTAGAA